ncbi:MAG: 5'/3'-nucleotidase SurE [Prevotella sp.]|nr:5'/3'-nucleotidase SurE [Prevotella sp.]
MKNKKPLILISNDDGYRAKGINCLIDMVRDLGDVLVCAPEGARSGNATAFSAVAPLRLILRTQEEGLKVWSCNGTPVDCVKLALNQFCNDRMPDIVIGGINHGDNASVNTHYSGTMGVALEGCMKYLPSVAFSLCDFNEDADFSPLRPLVRLITRKVIDEGLPKGVCLNVNFPKETFKGVRVCRMAHGTWYDECVKERHPRGYDYFWMVGRYRNDEPDADDTDNWALTHGYVAITPTRIDVTHYEMMRLMNTWDFNSEER